MFQPDRYISDITALLGDAFGERLLYVGLQGSYLRGEATEHSDIDVMVIVEDMTAKDLAAYRRMVETLPEPEKSCGFIAGREEMLHWNPLEICHLLHTTKDCFGTLAALVPEYTGRDVASYIKMSLGNLYHEICHRYIHAPARLNAEALPFTFRTVFFILQNLHYLETGSFIATKKELLGALAGRDRKVLETAVSLGNGEEFDFDKAFSLLLDWCREALVRTSSLAGKAL